MASARIKLPRSASKLVGELAATVAAGAKVVRGASAVARKTQQAVRTGRRAAADLGRADPRIVIDANGFRIELDGADQDHPTSGDPEE